MDLPGDIIFKTSEDHTSNLHASILKQKIDERFCDVTIKCGDSQFKAHKMILASATKYFEAMFFNDTKESETGIVEFPTMDSEVVKQCIDFIYSGTVGISMTIARSLLDASVMMQMSKLSELCIEFLAENVDVGTCAEVMSLARLYDKDYLELPIRKFLSSGFKKFRKTQDFLSLDYDGLVYCLGLIEENQHYKEMEKWLGILSWTKADHARHCYFEQIFRILDLRCLSIEFVSERICCEELVNDSKKCLQLINENVFTRHSTSVRKTDLLFESPHIVTVNEKSHMVYRYDIDTEECSLLGKIDDDDLVYGACDIRLYSITEHNGSIYVGTGNRLWSLYGSTWEVEFFEHPRGQPSFNAVVGCGQWVVMVSTSGTVVVDTSREEEIIDIESDFDIGFFVAVGRSLPSDGCQAIYVMGGNTVNSHRSVWVLNLFDGISNNEGYSSFPSLNIGRHLGAGLWYRDTIYAIGGGPQSVEYFSLVTEQWQVIRDRDIDCFDSAVCLGDDKLYIFGGQSHDAPIRTLNLDVLNVSDKEAQITRQNLGEFQLFCLSTGKRRKIEQ